MTTPKIAIASRPAARATMLLIPEAIPTRLAAAEFIFALVKSQFGTMLPP